MPVNVAGVELKITRVLDCKCSVDVSSLVPPDNSVLVIKNNDSVRHWQLAVPPAIYSRPTIRLFPILGELILLGWGLKSNIF